VNATKKIIIICVIISILSPIVSYVYFENMFNSNIQSYNSSLSSENERLTGVIEKLNQENMNLTQRLGDAENFVKPYLVTELGWYLHKSTDPVNKSRNALTIYGNIINTGATTAKQCSLTIKFYSNETLVQTSDVYIGDIEGWSEITGVNRQYVAPRDIACSWADSVTRIEITRKWS
jgi:hypothetical protein